MRNLGGYTNVILMLAVLFLVGSSAYPQDWNAASSEGITYVDVQLNEATNTYTWTLHNLSGTEFMPSPYKENGVLVLIWSLQPFNVFDLLSPTSWSAPNGWTWDASAGQWKNFEIVNNNKKYYTPPAIGPTESVTFTYTFDPSKPKINPFPHNYGGSPDDIGFIAHVGAVLPRTDDPINPEIPWTPDCIMNTWFDRSDYGGGNIVPEPSSMAALSMLGLPVVVSAIRRRRAG